MYDDSSPFEERDDINSIERTKPEIRKFASDNSKATLSAPKSSNKDFVSPGSIKSENSFKSKNANLSDLRASHYNPEKVRLRNQDKNFEYNYSFLKLAPNQNRAIKVQSKLPLPQNNFRKLPPKVIIQPPNKENINLLNRNKYTFGKKVEESKVDKSHNYSSFGQKSLSRKPSPFLEKRNLQDSLLVQKSFFKEVHQNQAHQSKNTSLPSDITNIIDSAIKGQHIEKSLVNNSKSRNANRNQKLEGNRSSLKDKPSLKVHTVDISQNKLKGTFSKQIKSSLPLSQGKTINNKTQNKTQNKLVKPVTSSQKKTPISNKLPKENTLFNKSKAVIQDKRTSLDSAKIATRNQNHSKNVSQHSFLNSTKANMSTINDKNLKLKNSKPNAIKFINVKSNVIPKK